MLSGIVKSRNVVPIGSSATRYAFWFCHRLRCALVGAISGYAGITALSRRMSDEDPLLLTAIRNTCEFTGLALIFGYAIPVGMAVLLNELRHFTTHFRLAVYLPVMLPPIVSAMLWQFFYDPGDWLAAKFKEIIGCRNIAS